MSIRALAMEVYKARRKVEELRQDLDRLLEERPRAATAAEQRLREAEAELRLLEKMFQGRKESAPDKPPYARVRRPA